MNAAQKAKSPSLGEIAAAAAFVVGLVTAWLYLAGWTYAYHYFDRFGIPLLMVDIPKENYFIYGGIVLLQFPIWDLLIVLVLLAGIVLWRWLRLDAGRLKVPLSLVALLAVFWLGPRAAAVAAHEQFIEQRESDFGLYTGKILKGGQSRPISRSCRRPSSISSSTSRPPRRSASPSRKRCWPPPTRSFNEAQAVHRWARERGSVAARGARTAGRPGAAHRRAHGVGRKRSPVEALHLCVHSSACGLGLDR
jgi:hypothetical protein